MLALHGYKLESSQWKILLIFVGLLLANLAFIFFYNCSLLRVCSAAVINRAGDNTLRCMLVCKNKGQ